MKIIGICILFVGGILLLTSVTHLVAYIIFEKFPHKTARAFGKLWCGEYKKDVKVWFWKGQCSPRVAFIIKHLTKTKYLYKVNDKSYLCACEFLKKPSKVACGSWVVYLKAIPSISYLDNNENYIGALDVFLKGIIFFLIAACVLCLGIVFLNV